MIMIGQGFTKLDYLATVATPFLQNVDIEWISYLRTMVVWVPCPHLE